MTIGEGIVASLTRYAMVCSECEGGLFTVDYESGKLIIRCRECGEESKTIINPIGPRPSLIRSPN